MAIVVTHWTAAEAKFKQNVANGAVNAGDTSLGIGHTAGPNGCDVAAPIQLTSTRFIWLFDDVCMPTASGQNRVTALTNNSVGFVHTVVGLQVGADPSTATWTYYAGGASPTTFPRPFFEAKRPAEIRYAMCGVRLDEVLLVFGMAHFPDSAGPAGTQPAGPWCTLLSGDLDAGTPDTWIQCEVPMRMPGYKGGRGYRVNWISANGAEDGGDGWVYVWFHGPWNQTGQMAVARFDRALAKQGNLRSPQWFNGRTWTYDQRDADGLLRRTRYNVAPPGLTADQPGTVRKRADGKYQFSCIKTPFNDTVPTGSPSQTDPRAYVSLRNDPAGAFPALTEVYDIPIPVVASGEFLYSAHTAPPAMTFSGKGATDQILLLSRNGGGALSDARTYWPEFYQVTGLP